MHRWADERAAEIALAPNLRRVAHQLELLVGHVLQRRVGKDPSQSRAVASEEARDALLGVDGLQRAEGSRQAPCDGAPSWREWVMSAASPGEGGGVRAEAPQRYRRDDGRPGWRPGTGF